MAQTRKKGGSRSKTKSRKTRHTKEFTPRNAALLLGRVAGVTLKGKGGPKLPKKLPNIVPTLSTGRFPTNFQGHAIPAGRALPPPPPHTWQRR